MSKTKEAPGERIDAIMERASHALVERRYFDAERLCLEALELAHREGDYARMARICLPLQESRRQKRDLAADAREVFIIDDQLPKPGKLHPGCYLVRPPRVGLDGRLLREMADHKHVPIIVLVREPTTRAGLWPIVALGPVTIRTHVKPPEPPPPKKPKASGKKKPAPASAPVAGAPGLVEDILPPVEWFLSASEQLGDAAIGTVDPARGVVGRVEDLLMRLAAFPDHEKLHQVLAEACEAAARAPEKERRTKPSNLLDELDDEEGESEPADDSGGSSRVDD